MKRQRTCFTLLLLTAVSICSGGVADAQQPGPISENQRQQELLQQFLTAVAVAKSNLGASYYVAGEFDSAMVHLGDALSIAPEYASAHLTSGLIEYERGNVTSALEAFQAATSGDSLGQNRMKMVHPDTVYSWAQDQFKGIVKDPPVLSKSHTLLALLYNQTGYLADAEKHYLLAMAADSLHVEAYTNLGKLYSDSERFADSQALYEKALNIPSDDETKSKVFLNLGVAHMGAQQYDSAISAWRSAIGLKSDYPEALMNIGIAFQAKAMPDSARTYWEQSLVGNENFVGARMALARLAVAESRLRDAREMYESILAAGVEDPRIFAELAFVFEREEDFDTAISYYEKALELAPDAGEIQTSMAIVRNKARQHSVARQENKVRVRHIVVASRTQAEALVLELRNGADFNALARSRSTDASSSVNGGDLGFFGEGEMIPAFEEAVRELTDGGISDIVETPMGFHILKRED